MNKEQFIDLVFSMPLKNFQGYGNIVAATDIYSACTSRGIAIPHPVNAWLEQLEKDKIISLVYNEQSGFEDILIGIKLPASG